MFNIFLYKALFITTILLIITLGNRLINKLLACYYKKIASKTKSKLDDEILPLIQRLLNIGVFVIGFFFIFLELGINVIGLYTGLGISSLFTAILVKESATNIIAGVILMFDRPFKVGDKIKLASGDIGEVIKIGLRRTNVLIPRTKEEKSVLVIPNKDLSKVKVYNYTMAKELDND